MKNLCYLLLLFTTLIYSFNSNKDVKNVTKNKSNKTIKKDTVYKDLTNIGRDSVLYIFITKTLGIELERNEIEHEMLNGQLNTYEIGQNYSRKFPEELINSCNDILDSGESPENIHANDSIIRLDNKSPHYVYAIEFKKNGIYLTEILYEYNFYSYEFFDLVTDEIIKSEYPIK